LLAVRGAMRSEDVESEDVGCYSKDVVEDMAGISCNFTKDNQISDERFFVDVNWLSIRNKIIV
jgi:hypothetical protein